MDVSVVQPTPFSLVVCKEVLQQLQYVCLEVKQFGKPQDFFKESMSPRRKQASMGLS